MEASISVFSGFLLLAAPLVLVAQNDLTIYSGSLASGWVDASFNCSRNFANTAPVYSGSQYSISVEVPVAYGGLALYHPPFSTAGYSSISFWLNGGASGGQNLVMYANLAVAGGAQVAQANRYFLSMPGSNTWQQYTIPLSTLGVANVTNFTGFAIQDYAGTVEPVFYLDDVQLLSSSVPLPPSPQLTVNASQPIRTVEALWFGINTPIWDTNLDTPLTLNLLANMGTAALRFPGGTLSDDYHWASNIINNGEYIWEDAMSLANFIHVVTNLNAQTMITLNYGSGTSNEAAAWVAYCNAETTNTLSLGVDEYGVNWRTAGYWASLRASAPLAEDDGHNFLRISRAAPLSFKYWEIGNELYEWNELDNNYLSHDPYTYAVRSQGYISLIKAVDPTVKIGVVASPGVNSYANSFYNRQAIDPVTGQTNYGWTPVVLATLKSLGAKPDFAIFHCYPETINYESDALALEAGAVWATNASDLRGQITDYMGPGGANMELICTENNSVPAVPGKQTVSLVNGLYKVDSLAQLMLTEFKGLFWWDLRDGPPITYGNLSPYLYGWRIYGDLSTVTGPYPTYYTTELLPHFATAGDIVVTAASDYSLLSVYAVQRLDGSLTVLTINKDPVNTNTAQVSVAGFTAATNVAIYWYGIPQDTAAETRIGSPDISQTNFSVTGPDFSYAFPPYSATVMMLSPTPSIGLSTTTVTSSQNPATTGSEVTFTATVSGSGGIPTGIVVFNDGGNSLGLVGLNSSGTASLTTGALSFNDSPHSITAGYIGDGAFAGSSSGVLSQIILALSTTTLATSQNPSLAGSAITFTATVSGSAGVPTGTVTFFDGVNTLGAGTLNSSGIATFKTTALSGGGSTHAITAVYGGASNFAGSSSGVLSEVIFNSSATTVGSSQDPAQGGSLLTFTATVSGSGGVPAGTVAFYDGGSNLGVGTLNSSGMTALSTSALLAGGSHSITAVYSGNSAFVGSTSSVFGQVITNLSTTAVTSSQNPAVAGTLVTFSATVSGNGGTPTGSVTFFDGTTNLGSAPLNGSGLAAFGIAALSVGASPHSITAVYGGNSAFGGSSSGMLSQIVVASVSIPLVNASFESPAGAQGTAAGQPVGWVASLGDPSGVYNPAVGLYTNEVNDILPSPAQGSQVLYMKAGNYVAQFLTNTLVANQTYTLSGAIGNRGGGNGILSSDQDYVALLVGNTFVAQDANLPHPPPGTFIPWTISYTAPATGFPSGPLQIRLGQNGSGQVDYDNIVLIMGLAGTTAVLPTTTAVTSSQNPGLVGSPVTFTATVIGSGGTPIGTVAFYDGSTSLGSGTLNGSGVVSLASSALSAAGSPHSITAVYGGDVIFAGSTSGALSQIITNQTSVSLTNGLSASWPLNEGSGTTAPDASGNGNTGTFNNGPLWVAGLQGAKALEFPGSAVSGAAYVSVPGSATLADQGIGSNLTIGAWVKRSPASVGNYASVVAKDILYDKSPYHRNYELIFDPGSHLLLTFRNRAGTSWEMYASSAAYTDTANWHFYGVTYTYGAAASCVLYMDGVPVAGSWTVGNGSDAPASTSGGPVLIGTDGTGTAANGSIYEGISIYDVTLSASQMLGLYNSGISANVTSATTVSSSQNPALAGSVVTFTATVSGSGGTPTGTVAFYDGSTSLGSGTLNNSGVVSLGSSALSVAGSPHSITAVYGGDGNFAGSTSGALSQAIFTLIPSATTVSSSQNPALAGSVVTFTATVSGSGGTPTGTVAFYDGSASLGSGTLNNSGVASLASSALSVAGSPHSITAVYGGGGNFAGSASGALSQIITLIPSATTVSSSQNPALTGSVVTFTATVSGSGGTPTGTVAFYDGSTSLGSGTLNNSGVVSLASSALSTAGSPHSITAVYGGGGNFAGSASGALSQIITLIPSATTVSSTQNPALAGSVVTFTATVSGSGGTPTGTVAFYDGSTSLGSGTLNNSGVASLAGSTLSVAGSPHSITAVYGGGGNFAGSTSGALSQVITLIPSATTVSSSQNPALAGSVVTFTATVSGSGGTPTGTVAFYDGSTSLGSGTLNNSGVASLAGSTLSVAGSPHSITAVYGGGGNFAGSASGALSQVITNQTSVSLTNGLSASWPLNEGSGTTAPDASGNGNTGTFNNGPLWVAGLQGAKALEFPGSAVSGAAYVSVPGSATLADQGIGSNLTICVWVKRSPASVGNYASVVAKDILYDKSPYHRNYELIFDTGSHLLLTFRNSAGTSWEMYASSAAYTDTANWHFYGVTYTYGAAASCVLYVDGVPVAGSWTVGNGSDAPASTSGGAVLIGTDGTGTAANGSIYEGINIYNVILSASQMLGLYNSGISAKVASTTTVSSSQNPALAGSVVIFTAAVSGSGGTPTGTVAFYDGSTSLGSGTLNGSGVVSLASSALSAAGSPHSITAVYGGGGNFAGSTSGALSQVITNQTSVSLTNGLSASWPLNEGSGTTAPDASGNGNTGTFNNGPLWVAGLLGAKALEFPGSAVSGAAYVSVPGSATLADQGIGSNLTICVWVKRSPASVGNYASVVAKDILYDKSPYHRNYELIFDTGSHLLLTFRNSAGTSWEMYASSAAYTDTANWHFYGVTYTYGAAASCALYVDGVPVAGSWTVGNGSDAPASTSGGPVLIGTDGTGTASNGSIYEGINIYNVILSASQMLGLYNSGP